jgi:heat shock protein HslJ
MFIFISCNNNDLPENGSKWSLIYLNGKKIEMEMTPFFKINTEKNTISGSGGCNRFSASFTYDDVLKIKQILSTKMACKESNVENEFFNALKQANKIKLEDNMLKIYDNELELAVFKKNIEK